MAILVVATAAATGRPDRPSPRSTPIPLETLGRNKQTVRRLYEECINGRRLELLPTLVGDDFVGAGGERGASGLAGTIDELRTGFPDIRFSLEDLIAEGDRVTVRWTWEGTHKGPFRGIAPSLKPVTNAGIAIYQIRDDKIVRAWLQTDRLGVLQQIGVIPAGAVPGGPFPRK
jgi:predicted ester cyclase